MAAAWRPFLEQTGGRFFVRRGGSGRLAGAGLRFTGPSGRGTGSWSRDILTRLTVLSAVYRQRGGAISTMKQTDR